MRHSPLQKFSDEEHIKWALCLKDNKDGFAAAVIDTFNELNCIREKERIRFKTELEKLKKELGSYKEAYFDEYYNKQLIERAWQSIGNYNRKHLELHEAIREKIRELDPQEFV